MRAFEIARCSTKAVVIRKGKRRNDDRFLAKLRLAFSLKKIGVAEMAKRKMKSNIC